LCVPYAGGGVAAFARWPAALPRDTEVAAVQLPAREGRIQERPITDMALIAGAIAAELEAMAPLPLVIFAYSVGARVAFEVVRRLVARGGVEPVHFIAAACRAPRLGPTAAPLHTLSDAELVRRVHESYGGIPQPLLDDPSVLAMFLPALRADLQLMEAYDYREAAPLNCPITVFGGRDDRNARPDDLAGWRLETTGPFAVQLFPGDHFFLNTARAEVLQAVGTILTIA
jgi:medium-chain acyl-[acyl-carrier-protein] hydrolase